MSELLEATACPPTGAGRLRNVAWLLGVLAVATSATLPIWREAIGQISAPPGIEPREVYAPGDPNQAFDHGRFGELLAVVVDCDGFVDYAAVVAHAPTLEAYLDTLADARFEELSRDGRLAFLLNAYNAGSLLRLARHWPLDSIETLPPAARDESFEIRLFSTRLTLAELEHEWIRARFVEPRTQFALHRARIDSPPLRAEAYSGLSLERQLDEQVRGVYRDRRWFRFDPTLGHLELAQFHLRYADDFAHAAGSLLDFVRGHVETLDRFLQDGGAPRVDWLPRDPRLDDLTARATMPQLSRIR